MENVNEQILNAISIMIESSNKKLKFDRTIKCQIVNADKAQSGEYRVKYYGDSFTAYSEDTTKIYKVNDNVYVRVPENNMDNKKFITEKVTNKNDVETSLEEVEDIQKVDFVGIQWDRIYGYPIQSCVTVVGNSSAKNIYKNTSSSISSADREFQRYSKGKTSFIIKGKFTTNFTEIPDKGNWGLRVVFKYKTPTDSNTSSYRTTIYVLDHTNMTGNSYNYTNSSIQYGIFSIEGDYLIGIERIELFQDGIILKNGGTICVEDLILQFVKPIEDYSTYSAHILTKEGVYLNERNHTKITLEAQYKYKGSNILSNSNLSNYKIFWFREDKSVGRFSPDYTKEGGIGWKLVDKDKIIITIDKKDVMTSARYKLVVNYDDYWINSMVEVFYEDSNYTLDIVFSQDMQDLSVARLEAIVNPISNDYTYYWAKETIDGEMEEISDRNRILTFDLTDVYLSTTYYCTIYKGNYLLGTVSKLISTDTQPSDLEVTFVGGDTTFLYDEKGDITIASAEEQRSLSFTLTWKNNKVNQYSFEWILPEAENSMLTDFIYNADKTILYYKIRSKYNVEKTDNSVSLVIKLNDGTTYEVKKDFIFLKQGNPGTNGTTFTTKISADKDCLISGSIPVNTMRLTLTAYKDGESANSLGYSVQTSWSIPSVYQRISQITVNSSGTVSVNQYFGNKNYYANIVKATTKISKGSESTTVYNYYPVMILKYSSYRDFRVISRVKDILYSSDGYNPNFASTTPWKVNPEREATFNSAMNSNPSVAGWKILGNTNASMYKTDEGWFFQAPKKYLSSDGAIAVLAAISNNDYVICPIVSMLNTYGLDWINSWDGLTVDINSNNGTILAPMIGAGEKNSDNTFTGTVMGIHSLANEGKYNGQKNGLVGYLNGKATYGFFSDGKGFIGLADKGRIEFDGNSGTITSGNYSSTSGMMIDLTRGIINAHDFRLETGTVYINAIPNATSTNVAIGVHPIGSSDYTFKVLHNGNLFAKNADIAGKITATSGRIGDVQIYEDSLRGGTIKAPNIIAGNLESVNIETSSLKSVTIDTSTLNSSTINSTTINTSTLNSAKIVGGNISGEMINGGEIRGGKIIGSYISGGTIDGGEITGGSVDGATITGGFISGTNISGSVISSGSATISNGRISGAEIYGGEISGATITAGNVGMENNKITVGYGEINWSGNAIRIESGGSHWDIGNGNLYGQCNGQANFNASEMNVNCDLKVYGTLYINGIAVDPNPPAPAPSA